MHKHVEWDAPGRDSVADHFAKHPERYVEPGAGDVLSARLGGMVVRIKVAAYVEGTSIGDVVALIDPVSGERMKSFGKLVLGDTVRLPDAARAFEPQPSDDPEQDDSDD
ncbi:hypothetical protein IEI94_21150 [Halomonas sp. ML-15]|uniref:hypothetical protein n=1 Tax=Halomonas sp. ML-15 TaxID=2773305 RepID=UPI001747A8F2|nr:hypothetical protein [Halomonas sp. ML-15]MBD3898368.1 hypothetical protein [Halomonas sp. ML-15]